MIIITSPVSPANNSCITDLPPIASSNSGHFSSTQQPLEPHHPHTYTLNNHGDITQSCLNLTLTRNHSLISIPTLVHSYYLIKYSALLSTIFLNFILLNLSHTMSINSFISYVFFPFICQQFINTQNTSSHSLDNFLTHAVQQTLDKCTNYLA